MEGASSFTAVPGVGEIAIGVTAVFAAYVASRQDTPEAWLGVWLTEAALAMGIALWTAARKAKAANEPLFSTPGRRFALSLTPPMVAGALFTLALDRSGIHSLLPGAWLLLYGAGIVTGGAFSVRVVPIMGVCFMTTGAVALLCPARWGDGFMALGFGLLHIFFGIIVARRHGG